MQSTTENVRSASPVQQAVFPGDEVPVRVECSTNLVPPPNSAGSDATGFTASYWALYGYKYPDGGGEVVGCLETAGPSRRLPTEGRKTKTEEEKAAERARRAKVMVRRRVRMAGLCRLWTFTFPQKIYDRVEAERLFARFVHGFPKGHRLERFQGANKWFDGRYVWVSEPHADGAYHIHLTADRYLPVDAIREEWHAFLMAHGFQRPFRKDGLPGKTRVNVKRIASRRAASYIAKYVAKSFDDPQRPEGRHRYRVGRNLKPVEPSYRAYDLGGFDGVVGRVMSRLPARAKPFVWRSDHVADWDKPPAFLVFY